MNDLTFTGWTIVFIGVILCLGLVVAVMEGLLILYSSRDGLGALVAGLAILATGVLLVLIVGGSMLAVAAP